MILNSKPENTVSKTILYIEDSEINIILVKRIFELEENITLLSAVSAEEGIQLAKEKKPDLILMDLTLPGMDGYKATELLKADKKTANIPVIALSAHESHEHRRKNEAAHFSDYISKPFNVETFFERIAIHLH